MFKFLKFSALTLLCSCAIISSPEGGEKDETPPGVVSTSPENKTLNFKAKEIVVEFDEHLDLKNFATQFYSSPPLAQKISPKVKGKKLYLTLNEELRPNTTYTFSFGNSLTDFTENNIQSAFKYVFSTGNKLDSLTVFGKAVDAYTGLPQEGVIALLYPSGIKDSTLLKSKPTYYTITDKNGLFQIENLALDTFQLFVVKDENVNLIYDHGAEKYGFVSYPIISGVNEAHTVRLFKQASDISLLEFGQKGFGRILLGFNKPVTNLDVQIVGSELFPDQPKTLLEPDENGDSLYFWYNPLEYPEDMPFLFLNIKSDEFSADSVRVLLKSKGMSGLSLGQQIAGNLVPEKAVMLETTMPVVAWDKTLIKLKREEEELPFELEQIDMRQFKLSFDKKYGDVQTLYAEPGAFTSLFESQNDSIALKTKVALEEDLAVLLVKLSSIDQQEKIFQLFKTKDRVVIEEHKFVSKLELNLKDVEPTKYGIRIIWDENKNGLWDVGEFSTRKQPEQVLYYPNEIELRANWELETVWEIPSKH